MKSTKFRIIAAIVLAIVLFFVYLVVSNNSDSKPQNDNGGYVIH